MADQDGMVRAPMKQASKSRVALRLYKAIVCGLKRTRRGIIHDGKPQEMGRQRVPLF